LQAGSDAAARRTEVAVPLGDRSWPPNYLEVPVGRFVLGFIVGIVVLIFIVVQCAQALF
jgi:hypothetical protein